MHFAKMTIFLFIQMLFGQSSTENDSAGGRAGIHPNLKHLEPKPKKLLKNVDSI